MSHCNLTSGTGRDLLASSVPRRGSGGNLVLMWVPVSAIVVQLSTLIDVIPIALAACQAADRHCRITSSADVHVGSVHTSKNHRLRSCNEV